jgi:hypothetical protein
MDSFIVALCDDQLGREVFARHLLELQSESEATKEQYGKNAAGMRMLMARRLVGVGVRFVSLDLRRVGSPRQDQG